MYYVFSKDTIEDEIIPNLPKGKRGFKPTAPLAEIISCTLYKLKTGISGTFCPLGVCSAVLFLAIKQFLGIIEIDANKDHGKVVGYNY